MDNVLVPYLAADDDPERQQQLDELLLLRAAPLIRGVLLRRLGLYVSSQGVNENNQDSEDLYQEAMTRVMQGLHELRLSTGPDIGNFELYVSRIATNICTDFVRRKSPARTRLKYRVRGAVKYHKDLMSWQHDGETLCGFALWRNTSKNPFTDQPFQDIETKLDSFQSLYFAEQDIRLAPLSQIVSDLFDWLGGPVEIDLLVSLIAYLLGVTDQQIESLNDPPPGGWDDYFPVHTQSDQSHLEANELLARLWTAVIQLPAEQRDAFAFGFVDEAGQDLFTLLVAAEIVNLHELAHGMGRSVAEVVELRMRLPMDTAGVANELSASRENVYKWRFRAIRRLRTELGR